MSRRLADAEPLSCIVLMKDAETEKRMQCVGEVLDYNEHEQMFIV